MRPAGHSRRLAVAALAALPIAMLTLAVPLANRVQARPAGFPFLLVWITAWIALTPVVLYTISRLERH